jgi:hypothetical protein
VYWKELICKHRQSGILVDTNLLLLLMIGAVDDKLIGGKRTERYTVEHYRALTNLLKNFQHLITTPHILTEVSNLGGTALTGKFREALFIMLVVPGLFRIETIADYVVEQHIPRLEVGARHIIRFGLTDAVIAKLCERKILLISDDFNLYGMITGQGGEAINFSHVWDFVNG